MNTKSLKEIQNEFDSLFSFESKNEQWQVDAKVLVSKFLSLVEYKMDSKGINKKDLAKLIDTSASYITQIFRGNKFPNFLTMAKIQDVLDIEFNIVSDDIPSVQSSDAEIVDYLNKYYKSSDGSFVKIIKNPFIPKTGNNSPFVPSNNLTAQS